jgi:hypothetical protein
MTIKTALMDKNNMLEVNIGNMKISGNGIISRSTLLLIGGTLISFGAYDLRTTHDLTVSSLEIILGGFILFVREFCKTIPNGEGDIGTIEHTNCDSKKRIW